MLGANQAWVELYAKVLSSGSWTTPRDKKAYEIIAHTTTFNMNHPIVTQPERKLGYRFMAREAWWILSGRNDVESIKDYSKRISEFSDDGILYFGAYGPRIIDQLPHVIRILRKDPESRQAIISIWKTSPPDSKDIPCTLSIQFLIRDSQLNCVVTMRSSDVWLGVPYDWFNFSMLSVYLIKLLQLNIKLGDCYFTAGSQHLYEENLTIPFVISELTGEQPTITLKAFFAPQSVIQFLKDMSETQFPLTFWRDTYG